MKAVVKFERGPGNVELREVPQPEPGPGQVKIEVKAAGVCGSDLHIYHDDIKITIIPPVVMGHEFSGVIVGTGRGVTACQAGDRVTCETTVESCGACLQCQTGHYNMCATRKVLGYSVDGCFARYCVVNERQVHRLPDNVDFVAGALTEPLACCVHGVLGLTGLTPNDRVLIAGPGPIGLFCLQLAKATGAWAAMCGTSQDFGRLALARELGADATIDGQVQDVPAWLAEHGLEQGVDVFLECSGAPAAARLGLDATRRRGRYTQLGLSAAPFELDFSLIAYKELRVTGALGQRWPAWEQSLDLLRRGLINANRLVSDVLPLGAWWTAFEMVEAKKGLKIVLQPSDEGYAKEQKDDDIHA
ncbi:MAG: zinc-binding dehydrogenase [Nitrososphaerales archaeon]